VRLQPQPFRLLMLLVRRAGDLVTREEIREQLWGGETFVDFEQGENHCVRQIRTALGDDARAPRYVQTVPRRGYRFIASVEGQPAGEITHAPSILDRRSILIGGLLLLLLGTAGLVAHGWRDESPRRVRLLVLPFADLSQEGSLAGGLTYEITTELVRSGGLDVVRVPVMPASLDADFLLEGSVQRVGPRVRVTAQLSDAQRRSPIWAESYERDVGDLLSAQTALSNQIVGEIRARLAGNGRAPRRTQR
jgi:TolB-like protein